MEINADAQLILRSHFPGVPIHSDIRDYQPEPEKFELITMGFPCTGTSNAGSRTGLKHPASSLWREGLRWVVLQREGIEVKSQDKPWITLKFRQLSQRENE